MYTNGYMLTPKYLEKNPEIFNLDSLRISFYGIDEAQYFDVTKKKSVTCTLETVKTVHLRQ